MSKDNNLRKIRVSKNLTQQNVADHIGVERRTYANWESGESGIKDDYILAIAAYFGVEISELLQQSSSDFTITQNNKNNKNSKNSF